MLLEICYLNFLFVSQLTHGILSAMLAVDDQKDWLSEIALVLPKAVELSIAQGREEIGTQDSWVRRFFPTLVLFRYKHLKIFEVKYSSS